ncbi:MAG: glycosyltransferase family 39 protein [Candidatus Poribacteria bacterium]|nr:glycosyltransferase family 39 protein [Candidatus Poribacteria bacterium]
MKLPIALRNSTYYLNILIIPAILVIGFGLRILGIGVGLPDTPDPREPLIAQDILNLINFTAPPEIYNWPGTAWFYLIALIGKVLSICGLDMTEVRIIWLARFINVLLSTSTIWLTYCLGTQVYNKRVGQIAAGFLAVVMLHATNESRFALVDIPATFCVTLFLWLATRDTHLSLRTCLWLGIIAGIGIAVKFPTVFVGFSLLIFIRTENFYRKFVTVFGVAAITFTLICPYWLIDLLSSEWNHFFDDFWYETRHYHKGHFGLFATGDTAWLSRFLYLWILLKWGMGLPLALLVGFGVIYALAKSILSLRKSATTNLLTEEKILKGLIILAFVILYLLFIGTFKVSFTRHLLILYPALTVLGAIFLVKLDKRISIFVGSAIWLYSFVYTAAFASVMLSQPTTQEVSEWVSTNIPHESSISRAPEILFDWLIPELDRDMVYPDEEFEWALIIQPNREVFDKYEQNPQDYEKVDWYPLEEIEIEETQGFYDRILGESSHYELHKTFRRIPQFLRIQISDNGAPFPMRALVHPEIRLYRRIE